MSNNDTTDFEIINGVDPLGIADEDVRFAGCAPTILESRCEQRFDIADREEHISGGVSLQQMYINFVFSPFETKPSTGQDHIFKVVRNRAEWVLLGHGSNGFQFSCGLLAIIAAYEFDPLG